MSTAAANPPPLRAWYAVGVLLIITAISYADKQAISLLVLPMQADLRLTESQVGILLGPAFTVTYALAGIPAGHLADRYNRRNILLFGLALWSLGTFLCGISDQFAGLVAARAMVGAGEAALIPAAFSLVTDLFPPDRRGTPAAVVTLGFSLGAGLSMFVGGLLLGWLEGAAAVPCRWSAGVRPGRCS